MEERYRHLVEKGYNFEMGKYMSEGWELFKKGAGSFIGYVLVYFVIIAVASFIPFVNFAAGYLQYVLLAGFFVFCRNLLHQKEEFGNFFAGFNYLGDILIYYLIGYLVPGLIFVASIFPFELIPQLMSGQLEDPQEFLDSFTFSIGARLPLFLILLIGFIYITVSYSLVPALITDAKLSGWTAMETSRKIVGKNFFGFLGMYLVLGLLLIVGTVLTCGLGLLVLFPYLYCTTFKAYDSILNPYADTVGNQLDEFGRQDKDINTESEEK